jgi:hypothetical protein
MKRRIEPEMIIRLVAILFLFSAVPASGGSVVDQQQWTSNGTHNLDIGEDQVHKVFDQAITAGKTGLLTNVEFEATIETNNVYFYIVDGDRFGGEQTSAFYVNLEPGSGLYNIDVSSAKLWLNSGDNFSMGFQSFYVGYGGDDGLATTNGSFSVYLGQYPDSAYAGGSLYWRYGGTGWLGLGYDDDMKFRTYIAEVLGLRYLAPALSVILLSE